MSLQDIQQQNSARKSEIVELVDKLNTGIEAAHAILEASEDLTKGLKAEETKLAESIRLLTDELNDLKKYHAEKLESHQEKITDLQIQEDKLRKLIKEAQDEYTQKIAEKNAVRDSLEDDKKDFKERKLSFDAKVRAFKKEREDFNFDKRKFEAEKGAYNDII